MTPTLLIILDGWGVSSPWGGNAIALANTPNMHSFMNSPAVTTLKAHGEAVGLPTQDPGNSEVGHLTIGAGKVILQDLPLISGKIADGTFATNPEFLAAMQAARAPGARLHLVGLVSPGGVHSHVDHLYALLSLAQKSGVKDVAIHMITDGRDTSPYAAVIFLNHLLIKLKEMGLGTIASIIGRYYAMDRDTRWNRTQSAYEAMVLGKGASAPTAQAAISTAYQQSYTDEFIPPTVIGPSPIVVKPKDAVIFFNFRPDRMRQLVKAFVLPKFNGFSRTLMPLTVVTMTEYDKDLPVRVAFRQEHVEHPLGEVVSASKLTQFHIAETEKYAHVTYFFNGQRELPFPGEARVLIPSPRVPTYDQEPTMSAGLIAERVVSELKKGHYDFFVINFANADMVAHTGNLRATQIACETIDEELGKIVKAASEAHANIVITSDHGNAEELLSPKTGDIDTAHNANPVPLIILSAEIDWQQALRPGGGLADVAPTILTIMGLPIPTEMTGTPLFAAHKKVAVR